MHEGLPQDYRSRIAVGFVGFLAPLLLLLLLSELVEQIERRWGVQELTVRAEALDTMLQSRSARNGVYLAAVGAEEIWCGVDQSTMRRDPWVWVCRIRGLAGVRLVGAPDQAVEDWQREVRGIGLSSIEVVSVRFSLFGTPYWRLWLHNGVMLFLGLCLLRLSGWRLRDESGAALLWTSPHGMWLMIAPTLAATLVALLQDTFQIHALTTSSEGGFERVPVIDALDGRQDGVEIPVAVLTHLCVAPVIEEVFYRGGVLALLLRYLSAPASIAITSAAFALGHGVGLMGSLQIFAAAVLLGLAWVRTRSVAFCAISHFLVNLPVVLQLLRGA